MEESKLHSKSSQILHHAKSLAEKPVGPSAQISANHTVTTNPRNENILCAVLALLKELDESGLELVKRDIDRKIPQLKRTQQ